MTDYNLLLTDVQSALRSMSALLQQTAADTQVQVTEWQKEMLAMMTMNLSHFEKIINEVVADYQASLATQDAAHRQTHEQMAENVLLHDLFSPLNSFISSITLIFMEESEAEPVSAPLKSRLTELDRIASRALLQIDSLRP